MHLAGVLNVTADEELSVMKHRTDWRLCPCKVIDLWMGLQSLSALYPCGLKTRPDTTIRDGYPDNLDIRFSTSIQLKSPYTAVK